MAFLIILYFTAVDLIDYLVKASKSHYLAFAMTNFRRARIFFLKILRIVPSFILILNHVWLSEDTVFVDIILNRVVVNALISFY